MKVGMVCPYDWSYPGGVRSHITGLVPALKRRGVEVQIIAPASRPEPDIFRAGRTIGIPFNGSVARLCFSIKARNKIAARLAKGDFDLLHIHEPASPSIGLLALSVSRIPVVATFHAASAGSRAYALARPVLARPFRRITERIAVSSEALRLVSAHFPGNYEQIPNGIDRRLFSSAAPRAELQALKPFVLFVGRDEPRKGLRVALEAMGVVRSSFDARLVVAGDTSMRLPDWATRLGAVPNQDLPSVYRAADVFVAPSLRGESFGIV
ncbi:MAG: glycosyltransferase family 4 protein, partial [Actinomycetota bacterium]